MTRTNTMTNNTSTKSGQSAPKRKKRMSILNKTLARALSMMRPHATLATNEFTDWLFNALPPAVRSLAWLDAADNLHVDTRQDPTNRTLFTAHVDTVHRKMGANKIRKTDSTWYADGAPLGADDGVGCALLMHLIHAKVPAYYVFTQGEEVGGIGAKHLAKDHATLLAQFDRAIAFDRKGTDSVITHQGYGRTASDVFGQALADALNETDLTGNLMYSPDETGVYTDTAEFTDTIPECTNVSCGYYSEHTDKEHLDMHHFAQLGRAVVLIDWDALPTSRDPKVLEVKEYGYTASNSTNKYDPKWYTSAYSSYPSYDEAYYGSEADEYLMECLLDAEFGFTSGLIGMMAASVYPEDPAMARKFISKKKLTEEAIALAKSMVGSSDTDAILATLFDMAYAE